MITIDGSQGEGGGQILRTALSLSLVTGRAFEIVRIRAGRKKPGLMRQHLTAVTAATQIGRAKVAGAEIGSQKLRFVPGVPAPGHYHFSVGTAGSTGLVLQTILPALITAGGCTAVTLEGGTHNPFAPPFDFLVRSFLPLLNRMGPRVQAKLIRPGFFPAGGGCVEVDIEPAAALRGFELTERGAVRDRHATVLLARLPHRNAEREVQVIRAELDWPDRCISIQTVASSAGPGNAVVIEIASEHVTEVFTAFGRRGVRAEAVANDAVRAAQDYLRTDVPVGEHLADQLLLPLALAGGGGFRTHVWSAHAETNAQVIRMFLDVPVATARLAEGSLRVAVGAGCQGHRGSGP